MAENKNINVEILKSEANGWFKGERKEQIDNAEKKIMQLLKEEGLSIAQARYVIATISHELKEQGEILLASTKVE